MTTRARREARAESLRGGAAQQHTGGCEVFPAYRLNTQRGNADE